MSDSFTIDEKLLIELKALNSRIILVMHSLDRIIELIEKSEATE